MSSSYVLFAVILLGAFEAGRRGSLRFLAVWALGWAFGPVVYDQVVNHPHADGTILMWSYAVVVIVASAAAIGFAVSALLGWLHRR